MKKWKIILACGIAAFLVFFFISTDSLFDAMTVTGLSASLYTPAADATENSPVLMSLGYLAVFFAGDITLTMLQDKNKSQRDNDLLTNMEIERGIGRHD